MTLEDYAFLTELNPTISNWFAETDTPFRIATLLANKDLFAFPIGKPVRIVAVSISSHCGPSSSCPIDNLFFIYQNGLILDIMYLRKYRVWSEPSRIINLENKWSCEALRKQLVGFFDDRTDQPPVAKIPISDDQYEKLSDILRK